MPATDTLAALAADLEVLPRRERRAVLRALSRAERDRLAALITAARQPAPPPPAARDPKAIYSPWLVERLRAAEGAAVDSPAAMTAAGRRLLLQAARDVAATLAAAEPAPPPARGAPLLDAIGALLSPRRWAR